MHLEYLSLQNHNAGGDGQDPISFFLVSANFDMVVGNLHEPSHSKWLRHMISSLGLSHLWRKELRICQSTTMAAQRADEEPFVLLVINSTIH